MLEPGNDNEPLLTKGYMLAALARSHKGSYGSYAEMTATYLRDAKFSGLTPEFVMSELLNVECFRLFRPCCLISSRMASMKTAGKVADRDDKEFSPYTFGV